MSVIYSFSPATPVHLPIIYDIFKPYFEDYLEDDYTGNNRHQNILELVQGCAGWFFIVTKGKDIVGCVWLDNWLGHPDKGYHSCDLHGVAAKGKGYNAVPAGKQMIDFLFNERRIERLQLQIPATNKAAKLWALRLGFNYEGTSKSASMKNGNPVDYLVYRLLKGEYTNGKEAI